MNPINKSQASVLFTFLAVAFLFFLFSCEKEAPQEIILTDPELRVHYIPETIKQTSTDPVLFMAKVDDPQGIENINNVHIQLSQQETLIDSGSMWDDGKNGDIIAHNGTYTYAISAEQHSLNLGELLVKVRAEDQDGNTSEELTDTVLVVGDSIANDPPEIVNVTAPDTISRSQQDVHVLTAEVRDPQGLADIEAVYFNSFRPDGTPASGNPFSMYDNGDTEGSGDAQAGDGIYSFKFTISTSNELGEYRFEVQARDKSKEKSDIVVHIITVVE